MRLPGWENRLNDIVEEARSKTYVLGSHDCLRVACATVEAMVGEDYWSRFCGYTTKRQAIATILRVGSSLDDAVTKTLGVEKQSARLARRGDLIHYFDGEDHLGVCLGERVAVLSDSGLHMVNLLDDCVRGCWRIG